MDLATAMSTERRVLEPICAFSEHDGYEVYRSERFPRFYGGNGIRIRRADGRSLADFERVFAGHFDPAVYEHRTFTFADAPEFEGIVSDAARCAYHVTADVFLFADRAQPGVAVPATLAVRRVDTPERWEMLRRFQNAISAGYDWYDGEAASDGLFRKTRFTSEAIGIDWYYVGPSRRDEMWAKLGIFSHAGVCRLQDVGAAPERRRQRLATVLVNHAIDLALRRGSAGLVVCAARDYHALDLYRKLGFRDLGGSVELMAYKVRNARYFS